MRPRLLDLFCGAGGCTAGYQAAGFDVWGVDIRPQPNYRGDHFMQADTLEAPLWFLCGFDAIHASPPCQAYSFTRHIRGNDHPDLVGLTRDLLELSGRPYVIENVPGAPLIDPVVLEGQMFEGLRTQRKRLFETNWPLDVPFLRSPRPAPNARMGRQPKPHEWMHVVGNFTDVAAGRTAMGIDWMTKREMSQAIPPAYTELIGRQLLAHLEVLACA